MAADRDLFIDPGDGFHRPSGAWTGTIAIENVHIISMVEGERPIQRGQTVVIEDGYITQIDKKRRVEIPEGATVIDGKRNFLMAGLIDTHVHVWMGDGRFPGFDEKDLWTIYLANGITTINEMVGADSNNRPRLFLFDWRRDVERGKVVGPTLFSASPRFRDDYQGDFAAIDAAVREYERLGYDMIKVHAPNSLPNYLRLFQQAEKVGIRPVGHPPYRSPDVPVETVLEHQTMISHTQLLMFQYRGRIGGYDLSPAEMRELAAMTAEAGTLLQPTPATTRIFYYHKLDDYWNQVSRSDSLRYFPPAVVSSWVDNNDIRTEGGDISVSEYAWRQTEAQSREMAKAGVPMIAGSDSGGLDLTPHGFFFHDELQSLRHDVGLSGLEVLATATRNAAEFLRQDEVIGTIEVGKRADLVLVDRHPIRKTENAQKIEGVMVRGKWLPWSRLEAALEELAGRMASKAARSSEPIPMERDLECHGGALGGHFGVELSGTP